MQPLRAYKNYKGYVSHITKHNLENHRPVPFLVRRNHERKRMRRVLEQIVIFGLFASDDIFRFLPDLNHSIAESIDLFERFGLGRLDQHTGGDRP